MPYMLYMLLQRPYQLIVIHVHSWEDLKVFLTSEVSQRPTKQVKLTLEHPANQATELGTRRLWTNTSTDRTNRPLGHAHAWDEDSLTF